MTEQPASIEVIDTTEAPNPESNGESLTLLEEAVYNMRKQGFSVREMSRKLKKSDKVINRLIQVVDERIQREAEEEALTPLEKAAIELGKRRQEFLAALKERMLAEAPEDPAVIDRLVELFKKLTQTSLVAIEEACEFYNDEALTASALVLWPQLQIGAPE